MKKYFIGIYHPSVILTYIGVSIALYGIFQRGETGISYICLVLSGICDLFDGSLARRFKRSELEKNFGIQIDSLADVISFGMLPVSLLLKNHTNLINMLIATFYLLSSIARLAWFNVTTSSYKGAYTGLPVTYAAFFVPILYSSHMYLNFSLHILQTILYFCLAIFFILNIPIKKPSKFGMIFFSICAVAVIVLISMKL